MLPCARPQHRVHGDVWVGHFGPPERFYGEPTPVRYQFFGQQRSEAASWLARSGVQERSAAEHRRCEAVGLAEPHAGEHDALTAG